MWIAFEKGKRKIAHAFCEEAGSGSCWLHARIGPTTLDALIMICRESFVLRIAFQAPPIIPPMKRMYLLPCVLLAMAAAAMAGESPTTNAPARGGGRGRGGQAAVRSPEISADRQVTFRIRAARASEVRVNGQWPNGSAAMTNGSNDVWSVTVGPVEPGVWEYSFNVDGLGMIDSANPWIKPMREPRTSILHLPGNPPRTWDFQDVPHGVVRTHTYRSKVLERLRYLSVYTPPRYDQETGARFPVLYLQHGSGDNQDTWTVHGKAHWILDNLIAQGKAKPMVVVMMDGHAAVAGGGGAQNNNTILFERDLMEEVKPFIESNYRVKTDAANRAIVGLSMGGGQSLTIGLNHTDLFAWVGGFSSAVPSNDAVAGALIDSKVTNERLKLLWIGCGREDFLLQRNEQFIATLKEKGINHEWHLTDGNHSWPVWRNYLAEFGPKLFQ
jgi:enterochelin esterase family protein